MTGQQTATPPSAQKMESRQATLRRANLAILIVLTVQFAASSRASSGGTSG